MDVVSVEMEKCPDGAELIDRGPPYGFNTALARTKPGSAIEEFSTDPLPAEPISEATGEWVRYRTDRREEYTLYLGKHREAVVVEFVNATKSGLVDFVGKYGVPLPPLSLAGDYPLETILQNQRLLKEALGMFGRGSLKPAVKLFQIYANYFADLKPQLMLQGSRPVLSLAASNIYAFMALELASIMTGGAAIATCLHCGSLFVAGSAEGKRRGAMYCSNKCRVAHQRARVRLGKQ